MDLLQSFKQYLESPRVDASALTIKNYISDIRSFIRWYESGYGEFNPSRVSSSSIEQYRNDSQLSVRSFDRHSSSLRKFYAYLTQTHLCSQNPFEITQKEIFQDPWKLKEFKDSLRTNKSSYLTIKNYINDLIAFKKWCSETLSITHNEREALSKISPSVVEEYKQRLTQVLDLSSNTVNRKLSSIRKYIAYAEQNDLVKMHTQRVENIPGDTVVSIDPTLYLKEQFAEKSIAEETGVKHAIGKLFRPYEYIENTLANGITSAILSFKPTRTNKTVVSNIPKEFFAPHDISLTHLTWYQKLIFHLKYSRPQWYKTYHSYSFVHYVHIAVLIIVCVTVAISMYFSLLARPTSSSPVYADGIAPPRVILFRGKLVPTHTSTTSGQDLRFAIYNSPTASGSALLWQENQSNIKTDSSGVFSVILGENNPIPQTLIQNQSTLFVGVTPGTEDELSPRQRITGAAYADNADLLAGLPVITNSDSDTNVVLALDSTGNLIIGGSSDHTFQVTGGAFQLMGQQLSLGTNEGSNGDIVLSPDGTGEIDIQRPIKNSGLAGNIPGAAGAVEFDDSVAILATESAHAAFTIEQDGFGGLISAATSGVPKFTVDYNGAITTGDWEAKTIALRYGGTGADLSAAVPGSLTYIASQSAMAVIKPGDPGSVLVSLGTGAAPQWISLNNLATTPWVTTGNSILTPSNSSLDFMLGGQSTDSAKFAVLNMANGTPGLLLRNTASGNGLSLTSDGNIQSLQNGTLTLGGSSTGPILFAPGNTQTLALTPNGFVGVGTTNPQFKLDIQDNQSATVAAAIYNGNSGADADGLLIKLGNTNPTVVSPSNHFISFETAGIGVVGSIEGNGGKNVSYTTNGVADFAEYMAKDPTSNIPFGSLLCLNSDGNAEACVQDEDSLIGVASEHPTFVGGQNNGVSSIAVGMMGQIAVRVSSMNGIIHPGDPITTSPISGVGVKAVTTGKIIGRAVEPFDGVVGTEGKILVAVEPTWYDPTVELTNAGELTITSNQDLGIATPHVSSTSLFNPIYSVVASGGKAVQNIGVFSVAMIGNLKAGAVQAEQITTKSLAVTTDSLTVNGENLRKYIAGIVASSSRTQTQNASAIATNMISPLQGNDLNINLGDATSSSRLNIQANNKTVASIDTYGNATFSGTLSSANATVNGTLTSNNASISGTLHAGTIIASDISGLDQKIQSIASQSASSVNTQSLTSAPLPTFPNADSLSSVVADFATIQQGLIALGPTTLSDTSVESTLSVGTSLKISDNSINTFGSDLEVNPLGQGAVSFLAGKVRINTDGTVDFGENVMFAKNVSVGGTLATNIISPLGDSDVNIELNSQTNPKQSVGVSTKNGRVFSIDQSGNVTASGSANFAGDLISSGSALLKKLNLFAAPAYALSDSESVATGSAGTATIKRYHTETTIDTGLVTDHSLIYITPIGDTNNQVVSLLRQVPQQSFTVGLPDIVNHDVSFNWIIIN